jgi:hypothetical protein
VRILALLLLATAAHAQPVRDDIVDIRHQRSPQRRVVLGWTADNRFVVHVADCSYGDGRRAYCTSALEVTDANGNSEHTALFDLDCNPCEAKELPTDVAMIAIRAERDALRQLGNLKPSALASKPTLKMSGTECYLDLRVGTKHVKFDLGTDCINGGNSSLWGTQIQNVATSPDGGTLAITLVIDFKTMEWRNPMTRTFMLRN